MPWDAIYPPAPKVDALVELVTFAPELIRSLRANPEEMMSLSPERLEDLVAELVALMNCHVIRMGRVNSPDGGVDFVAVSKSCFPFTIAFQVKHHRKKRTTGIGAVREFLALRDYFGLGYLVTNTEFTKPAQRCAIDDTAKYFIRLRDRDSLRRWLGGDFSAEDLKSLPQSIDLPGGVRIDLSQFRFKK
jgi:hypothetical protein